MIKDGNVVVTIDWNRCGWYSEYWDFANALLMWGWQSAWTDYVVQILFSHITLNYSCTLL